MNDREHDHSREDGGDPIDYLRMAASILLLTFGVCAAIWLLVSIANTLSEEQPPGIVAAVAPAGEALVVQAAGQKWELPRQLFVPIAYFLLCFLYLIAASIVKAVISGGVTLLQPDFKKSLERLERIQGRAGKR